MDDRPIVKRLIAEEVIQRESKAYEERKKRESVERYKKAVGMK